MSVFLRRSCGAALAYAFATQGAFADLTADDVWANWQGYFTSMGYTVTGDESSTGGVTTISNMTLSLALPEEDGQFQMVMPEMTLTENGDGTVTVGVPENFPMVVTGQAEEGDFSATVNYTHKQLNMVVSGSPEDMTYDYTADTLGVVLDSIEVEGEAVPDDVFNLAVEANDLTGSSRMQIAENRDLTQTFNAASLTYNMNFQDPESGETGLINGQLDQLAFEGENVFPKDIDLSDPQSFYEAGFAFDGIFTYASGSTDLSGTSEGQAFSMNSTSKGGRFAATIDSEKLVYDIDQNSTKLAVTTADLPFPIEISMAKAGLNFEFPVQQSDEVQPFGLGFNLTDFTMSDVLWSIFDPAGALPRDPATIALDATGTAKVLMNIFDPEIDIESDEAPGELHSLKINELLVSLVGAKLTGDGDFAFDNSNTEEFDGLPSPIGVANLQLVGANQLIDTLIGMGIISDNDALGARMMMGLMAVPGEQPDTLNSTIEFTEDGQILANGQRLK
ncbi:DUF2125 domain-containing protein [Ruegeria sp. HKCCD4884]|uniref:DUF2125 domain-containing protein n=1 Tax=Ruegeria sp. HKCCD4884 TaxID=2683022 RepID=UPI0014920999|nr:DUF2125 domain-containing protein [Ruegeria sp. HKCCD4884]NOD94135.1 DUF2125 domain-containing protein [Ruegeria sp. HKCCD4884]